MAQARCMASADAFAGVTASGSGIRIPDGHEWSAADYAAVSGDRMTVAFSVQQTPETGYQLEYYEVAIEERGGATRTERVPYGPAVNIDRIISATTATTGQRVRIRSVQKLKNQFKYGVGEVPVAGDAVVQSSTSSTADVLVVRDSSYVVLENISGAFAPEGNTSLTFGGVAGTQISPLHVPHTVEDQVTVYSEWSAPVIVTPTTGSASVTASASKTTCLQGEGVLLDCTVAGFECDKPLHDLHYHWTVAKAGEQGGHETLAYTNCYFEDEFGAGQNNRCEGFSKIWAFTPITTGTVTATITVRDRNGNSATDTIDLTVEAPTSAFADGDIYVCSATSRAVAGTTSPNFYTDFDTLWAAIPDSGEALVLLDTTGSLGATQYQQYNALAKAPDRLIIMPYNDTGVGVDAAERVTIDFCFRMGDQTNSSIYGVDIIGPYDPTNPVSVLSRPQEAWHAEDIPAGAHTSVTRCKLNGWNKGIMPPLTGTEMAVVDVEITDFLDFGIHGGDTGKHGLSGCFLYQNPESWFYNDGKLDDAPSNGGEGFFTDHPGYRTSRPNGARGFSKCVFFASVSWGSPPGSQPAARLFGSAGDKYGEDGTFTAYPVYVTHMTECMFEAEVGISINCTANGADLNFNAPQDIVVDKFVYLGAQKPKTQIEVGVGPFTARNGRSVTPDQKGRIGNSGEAMFTIGPGTAASNPPQLDCLNQDIVLESISWVALQGDAQTNAATTTVFRQPLGNFPYSSITERNILHYAPNLTTGGSNNLTGSSVNLESGSGLNTTTRYTPLYQAYYPWDDTTGTWSDAGGTRLANNLSSSIDSSWALSNTVSATYEPQTGSGAIGAGEANQPYDDIFSRIRTTSASTRTIGAYDPGGT